MQSGKERRLFALDGSAPGNAKPKIIDASKPKAKSHMDRGVKSIQAITGIVTDTLNTVMVAGTLEGKLYVRHGREMILISSSSISIPQSFWLRYNYLLRLRPWICSGAADC